MSFQELKEDRAIYNNKLQTADDFFTQFGKLDDEVYAAGAIDKKHKELMGLAISLLSRCNECICYHLEGCFTAGASRSQVIEAIKIGVIGGGSITYPHARFAIKMLDEVYK